jgi:hypothetical protein
MKQVTRATIIQQLDEEKEMLDVIEKVTSNKTTITLGVVVGEGMEGLVAVEEGVSQEGVSQEGIVAVEAIEEVMVEGIKKGCGEDEQYA